MKRRKDDDGDDYICKIILKEIEVVCPREKQLLAIQMTVPNVLCIEIIKLMQ